MREALSVFVATILLIFVAYLAYSGSITLTEYVTALAVGLTITALGVLYWGFKPRIEGFSKNQKHVQESRAETATSLKLEMQKTELLPDNTHITKLNIDDELLDRIYDQARRTAIGLYHDAKLSDFTIQVIPYERPASVAIYLNFYSKWADKLCRFQYSDLISKLKHSLPDKSPESIFFRNVFDALPWKTSPQWTQFLDRAYTKIRPLPPVKGTCYHLSASPPMGWDLTFDDGLSGKSYRFKWNGKGLDENSIKQTR